MTRRIYSHNGEQYTTDGKPSGLLTDKYGGYLLLDSGLSYRGWHQFSKESWKMQKIIESIEPLAEGECDSFYNLYHGLKRVFSTGASDTFYLYGRTLLYEAFGMQGRVRLTLDHRDAYENSRLGRIYDIKVDGETITITFRQYDDNDSQEYEHHMIIRGARDAKVEGRWRKREYETDKRRKDQSVYWVYDALTFLPKRHVIFSAAWTDYEARTVADVAYHHSEEIISSLHLRTLRELPDMSPLKNDRLKTVCRSAASSILSLSQHVFDGVHDVEQGIFAGLPWFFQVWSRDELISLGGLISLAAYTDEDHRWRQCTTIINRHMDSLLDDGLLPNRHPNSKLSSIDALGWLAKRVSTLITSLKSKNRLFDICSIDEMLHWHTTLSTALSQAKTSRGNKDSHFIDGSGDDIVTLFHNSHCETWMDTSFGDDGRKGYRIEIQALFLSLYNTIILLSDVLSFKDKPRLKKERKRFINLVRKHFIDNNSEAILLDGLASDGTPDHRLRPNVFLAYYLAPNLFSSSKWKKACSALSEKLYMDWGGLSTLPSDDKLFQPFYTGEDNKSYHRGDSWYFVNNLSALAMHRLAKRSFSEQVNKILKASTADILEHGYAGHGSELSSAREQESNGSPVQAWSASTFLELVFEYHDMNE